jgi:hypothetical protein
MVSHQDYDRLLRRCQHLSLAMAVVRRL